ncbi:MAG: uridine kinase [Acidimicrobiales bacterium]
MSILVAISGGSGSGKTTLAEMVAERLGSDRAASLQFDSYYVDQAHRTPEERAAVNYDHPESLDHRLFAEHLEALRAGREAAVPVYDFATHSRTADVHIVEPRPVVVADGILLLAYPELVATFDLRVYRACPEPVRFERRLARDIADRGRTADSVHAQFAATVKPMHDEFVAPSQAHADIVTRHGEEELDAATERVLAAIDALVTTRT